MCPCLGGHIGAAPTSGTVKASDDEHFGAHSRSFGTCSPTLRASCCHSRARLASGWLAGLYREGVEPSGSLRKVSDHMTILLSCSPDATQIAADWLRRRSSAESGQEETKQRYRKLGDTVPLYPAERYTPQKSRGDQK